MNVHIALITVSQILKSLLDIFTCIISCKKNMIIQIYLKKQLEWKTQMEAKLDSFESLQ